MVFLVRRRLGAAVAASRAAALAALLLALVAASWGAAALVATPSAQAADEPGTTGQSRLLLVLDASGSMKDKAEGGTKIKAARTALLKVIDALPDEAAVGMRVFGSKVFSRKDAGACEDTSLVVPIGTDNRAALRDASTAYKPYGETPIPVALRKAAEDLGSEGERSIVLVSDGESTCGDPCPVAKQISKSGVDLTINVVGLAVSGKARAQLKCIAEAGEGTYYDADSAADIESTLEHVASRSLRPFTITGTPITGGEQSTPTPVTVGDWRDEFPVGVTNRYYSFERTTPGSILRVAAYTQGQAGESVSTYSVKVTGANCTPSSGLAQHLLDIRSVLGAQATMGSAAGSSCTDPGTFLIDVSAPSRLTEAVPFGLRISEEPPVSEPGFADSAPAAKPQALPASASATPVTGGAGFATATEIAPGTSSSTIVPGEFNLFRFHLDYGQSASISVTVPPVSAALKQKIRDDGAPLGRLALYSPMWAELGFSNGSEFSDRLGLSIAGEPEETTFFTTIPAVSATASGERRSFNAGADATVAGDYYIGFSAAAMDYAYEFPYTLTLQINGEPQAGPTYADGASWTLAEGLSAGVTGGDSTSPSASAGPDGDATGGSEGGSEGKNDAGSEDGSSTGLWIGLGVAAVLVLGGVGWLLSRRGAGSGTPSDTRSRPPGDPRSGPPGGPQGGPPSARP